MNWEHTLTNRYHPTLLTDRYQTNQSSPTNYYNRFGWLHVRAVFKNFNEALMIMRKKTRKRDARCARRRMGLAAKEATFLGKNSRGVVKTLEIRWDLQPLRDARITN